MANPGKFKLMILSKTNVNYSIKLLNKGTYNFRVTKPSTHHDESLTLKFYFTSIFRVSNSMRKKINIVLEFLNSRFLKKVRCQDLQNQNLPFKYKEIKD